AMRANRQQSTYGTGHEQGNSHVAWSPRQYRKSHLFPDGTILLSGSLDKTVLGWDCAAILRPHTSSKELSYAKLIELWSDLALKDAERAQRAVAQMIQAPDTTLPLLEKKLLPVRAAEMARIPALIADLDHTEFARRDKATTELGKIGTLAAPELRTALAEELSLEMRLRIEA